MAGLSLADAQAQLDAFLAASLAVAKGQAYQIGTRSFRRADLKEIQASITYWDGKVRQLTRGGMRMRRAIPIDV
jgi:thiamine pyrophosphate-dependent acetolactate synthase large subunit-like protein